MGAAAGVGGGEPFPRVYVLGNLLLMVVRSPRDFTLFLRCVILREPPHPYQEGKAQSELHA